MSNNDEIKMNFDVLKDDKGVPCQSIGDFTEVKKKKRGRPKKEVIEGNEVIVADNDLPMYQSNQPYMDTYNETNNMLRSSIYEIDTLNNNLKNDIEDIRTSRTIKKKYDYLSELIGTSSTLISTKVTAIREMNKTITDCHNLEMKRVKEMKLNDNAVDDDKRIMDMYTAFINTPIGTGMPNPLGIGTMDVTLPSSGIVPANIGNDNYDQSNITAAQNMMILEKDPNIKTVVVYDDSTGNRWFDVMNIQTGESLSNVEKPDPMFLENTSIDVRNRVARNTDLDVTYPLIVINGNPVVGEY